MTEKKSRFIGIAVPVSTEEEALAVIEDEKRRYRDARHHCSA
ncbi:YigZ family protein, partial [Anaerostipes caccae]